MVDFERYLVSLVSFAAHNTGLFGCVIERLATNVPLPVYNVSCAQTVVLDMKRYIYATIETSIPSYAPSQPLVKDTWMENIKSINQSSEEIF